MKHLTTIILAGFLLPIPQFADAQPLLLSTEKLKDKIKGGWAGQTIGVTFGAPVEFAFQGTMINDYHPIEWNDGLIKKSMMENPGIYDDLYMDLTFVEVFDKEGLDAPAESHAKAVANAGYMLWHANQAARYNVLNGILPPLSGHWTNNPHADCIDYQIEADYAGLMSPGMPNTASEISDKIGHIMNYGDGWYGGVYVGAMYALAFTSNDVEYIVKEALKTIPPNTKYHDCIADVIQWHQQYPNDWKQTWFEIQRKWTDDIGCPDGVFSQFNIDATVNSAYVVLGLLYGKGDFGKTIEIATRAGQDADCNPSTAAGILGTMLGYEAIPDYWKKGLADAEDLNFKYTNSSLRKAYDMSYRHALENIKRHGGKMEGKTITIQSQKPVPVRWEQGFTGLVPFKKQWIGKPLEDEHEFSFTGTAFVVLGECKPKQGSVFDANVQATTTMEMVVDDAKAETILLPASFTTRRHEIAWKYQLPAGEHTVKLKLKNGKEAASCQLSQLILYKPL